MHHPLPVRGDPAYGPVDPADETEGDCDEGDRRCLERAGRGAEAVDVRGDNFISGQEVDLVGHREHVESPAHLDTERVHGAGRDHLGQDL